MKAHCINFALQKNGGSTTVSAGSEGTGIEVIDGNRSWSNGKRWRTNAFPASVEIQFNAVQPVDTIHVFSQQDSNASLEPTKDMTSGLAVAAFNIEYWNGSEWVIFPGGEVKSNNKVWHTLNLTTSVETSKIRIHFPAKINDGWARLIEVEAWGTP